MASRAGRDALASDACPIDALPDVELFVRSLADVPAMVERALADIDATYCVSLEAPGDWSGPARIEILGDPETNLTHRESLDHVQGK